MIINELQQSGDQALQLPDAGPIDKLFATSRLKLGEILDKILIGH
jgi:hypothetical protein